MASDDVAAISSLLDGAAPIDIRPAEGPGPERVTLSIGLDQIDVRFSCPEGIGGAYDDVAAISGLLDCAGSIVRCSTVGSGPERVVRGFRLDYVGVTPSRTKRAGRARDDVTAIRSLLNGRAAFIGRAAVGSGPEGVTGGICLD